MGEKAIKKKLIRINKRRENKVKKRTGKKGGSKEKKKEGKGGGVAAINTSTRLR